MPAVPAAWSVTTIAFMVIFSSVICLFAGHVAALESLFDISCQGPWVASQSEGGTRTSQEVGTHTTVRKPAPISLAQDSPFVSNFGDCAAQGAPPSCQSGVRIDVSAKLNGPAMHWPSGRTPSMSARSLGNNRMAMKDVSVVLAHGAWADGSSWARVV